MNRIGNCKRIMCCLLAVTLLFSVVACSGGTVYAKYIKEIIIPNALTAMKNYFTVTYYNYDGTVYKEFTLLDNGVNEHKVLSEQPQIPENATFKGWKNMMNTPVAAGTSLKKDAVLQPIVEIAGTYTVSFFHLDGTTLLDTRVVYDNKTYADQIGILPTADDMEDFEFDYWLVRTIIDEKEVSEKWDTYKTKTPSQDISVFAQYKYGGALRIEGVDEDDPPDGIYEYFKVEAIGQLPTNVVIPGYIGPTPVKIITDLTSSNWADNVVSIEVQEGVERIEKGAFADTPALKKITLPKSLKYLGSSAFVDDSWLGGLGGIISYKTPEITYNGTKAEWDALVENSADDWANNLGVGTKVVCQDGYYTYTQSNWSRKWVWTQTSNA